MSYLSPTKDKTDNIEKLHPLFNPNVTSTPANSGLKNPLKPRGENIKQSTSNQKQILSKTEDKNARQRTKNRKQITNKNESECVKQSKPLNDKKQTPTTSKQSPRKQKVEPNSPPIVKKEPPGLLWFNSGTKSILDGVEDEMMDNIRKMYKQGLLSFNPDSCPQFTPEAPMFNLNHMSFIIINILLEREAKLIENASENYTESALSAIGTSDKLSIARDIVNSYNPKKESTFCPRLIKSAVFIIIGFIMGQFVTYF